MAGSELNEASTAADSGTPSTADTWAIGPSGPALAEDPDRLQRLARENLWLHFTRMGSYDEHHSVPVIVRGEGCYVYDEHGKRYLDGLSALYCVNAGHGRAELGEAAAAQAAKLGFYTNWSYAHPPRGDMNRHKLVSRNLAYHGVSMGALTATGLPPLREPFEPLTPGGVHVPNTNSYRWKEDRDPLWAADAIEEAIEFEGPSTVAAVILEPVQNGGGCFTPQEGYFQRVREICDRHGVLLISDEVICSWGRLGYWFGCERYGYQPDIITTAKGISSAYVPLGAMIAGDHIAEPFLHGKASFVHGFTFGGHPVACAVGLANIDLMEREDLPGNVRANEALFREMLDGLRDLPIVGDVRGAGYFHAIELVKDKETKETFDDEESEYLLRGFLSGELYSRGLICRTDDRGDPIVQLSPPLIAGREQFEEIISILRPVLSEASERMESWSSLSRA